MPQILSSTIIEFCKEYWYVLAAAAAVLLLIIIICAVASHKRKKKKRAIVTADQSVSAPAPERKQWQTVYPSPSETGSRLNERPAEKDEPVTEQPATVTLASPDKEETQAMELETEEKPAPETEEVVETPAIPAPETEQPIFEVETDMKEEREETAAAGIEHPAPAEEPVGPDDEKPEPVKAEVKPKESESHPVSAPAPQKYRVIYDKETLTWEVRKDGAKRVIRRVKTKEEALKIAKELSKSHDTTMVVHKRDGKFQKK